MPINRAAFPCKLNGISFRSRGEFENVVERFAKAGTKKHLEGARELLRTAQTQNKLSADQVAGIKHNLHL